MSVPKPSEINQSLYEKLVEMERDRESVDDALGKVKITLIGGSILGFCLAGFTSDPSNINLLAGGVFISSLSAVGTMVVNTILSFKHSLDKTEVKKEVLNQQLEITDKKEIKKFLKAGIHSIDDKYKEAIYNDEIHRAIEERKISFKISNTIKNIRETFSNNQSKSNISELIKK